MRSFDVFEKRIMSELKRYYENRIFQNFLSLIDVELENKKIKRNILSNTVSLHFDETNYLSGNNAQAYDLIEEVKSLSLLLVKTIFLLQYLESNGYIFMFDEGSTLNEYSRIEKGNKSIQYDITDKTVCKLINEYFTKTIIISQSITDLVNDNFISKEEIRHNENIRVANENLQEAKIAVQQSERAISIATTDLGESKKSVTLSRNSIWVAIGLGVLSLGLSTYSIWQSNQAKTQKVEIDSVQYQNAEKMMNSVIDNQKSTKNKLDSMSTYIRKIKK